MTPNYLRLTFDDKFNAVCKPESVEIDCPNQHGGIGAISFTPVTAMWTGSLHLTCNDKCSIPLSHLTGVEICNDYLSEEAPWSLVFSQKGGGTGYDIYKFWREVAVHIRGICSGTSKNGHT